MDNKKEKQESTNDLKAKLVKNLEETGYPVELKVGDILSKNRWWVEHNRYYIDEDEQKGREIDILAHTNSYFHSEEVNLCVWLNLVCEVKQARKHPWVILSTTRGLIEGEGYLRPHYHTSSIDSSLLDGGEIERRATTKQFTRIGRSYYEAFKSADAKSAIFEALTTTIKASEYRLKKEKGAGVDIDTGLKEYREITFVDPIVVLDGLLYEAYLNDNNAIQLAPISHIPVSFGYISGV